jgi:hypothetical protein
MRLLLVRHNASEAAGVIPQPLIRRQINLQMETIRKLQSQQRVLRLNAVENPRYFNFASPHNCGSYSGTEGCKGSGEQTQR